MYCKNCGHELADRMKFCPSCGSAIESASDVNAVVQDVNPIRTTQVTMGYSNKISDPKFDKYIKNTNRWAIIFSFIIAIAAVVGFYIAGERSTEVTNPEALYIGFGIGGMFLVIVFGQVLMKKGSKTWDGVVVDKTATKKKKKVSTGSDNNDFYWKQYMEYIVVIRSEKGKKHKLRTEDDATIYNYYNVGEKVRHHAGLNTFEKYDKTHDSIIFCNACATKCDITMDTCPRCKCPLLK
ncbi:MAG: zinc ribbon domain-containing protein [Clostridia bacterium]|nr:zinc ribbon domain-containing protein [Clostridia bacterium]